MYFPCAIHGLYTVVVRLCNIQVPPDGDHPDPEPALARPPAPGQAPVPPVAPAPESDVESEVQNVEEIDEEFRENQDQASMNEHDEPLPKPHNYRQYEFSESFAEQSVGPAQCVHQKFLLTTKDHLDAIEAKYNGIKTVRQRIDDFLKGFKQSLHVDEKSEFPLCFQRLRERAKDFETLELDGEELCITVDETADEDVKEPVLKFNFMLKECREFLGKQNTAREFIEEKISAVKKESVQTQATQAALQRANKQLEMLPIWANEIERLISATKAASRHLQPQSRRITTGIHVIRITEDQ